MGHRYLNRLDGSTSSVVPYGTHSGQEVIDAILAAVSGNIKELRSNRRFADASGGKSNSNGSTSAAPS
jgi:hypothetical protein